MAANNETNKKLSHGCYRSFMAPFMAPFIDDIDVLWPLSEALTIKAPKGVTAFKLLRIPQVSQEDFEGP